MIPKKPVIRYAEHYPGDKCFGILYAGEKVPYGKLVKKRLSAARAKGKAENGTEGERKAFETVIESLTGLKSKEHLEIFPDFPVIVGKEGFLRFQIVEEEGKICITHIGVPVSARSAGNATAMLQRLERIAKARKINALSANVSPRNIASKKFFQKNGFVEVKHVKRSDVNWSDYLVFEKELK